MEKEVSGKKRGVIGPSSDGDGTGVEGLWSL